MATTKSNMEVIGIKTAINSAWFLKEFFSQLASPMHFEKQIGIFAPARVVHVLGVATYAKLICDNNSFLQSVDTILISATFSTQHWTSHFQQMPQWILIK